jgi:hypothetical protein
MSRGRLTTGCGQQSAARLFRLEKSRGSAIAPRGVWHGQHQEKALHYERLATPLQTSIWTWRSGQ